MKIFFLVMFILISIHTPAKANSMNYFVEETITYDLDNDNSVETIERIFVGDDPKLLPETWLVRVSSKGKVYESKPISNTSINYSGSSLEIVKISSSASPLIVLWYSAGAYSQGLELLRFKDGLELVNHFACDGFVFCDNPIRFKDIDGDNIFEIITISRDWTHNSTRDKVIETYKYDGNRYEPYSTESTFVFAQGVYAKDNNVYFKNDLGIESQLTFHGKDHEPMLSPSKDRVIFIRHQKPHSYGDNDPGLFLNPFDELWSMDVEGGNKQCLVKNNYSPSMDMNEYIGNFDSLHFSPDGKKIYFLCQNCPVDAILYMANADGSDIRRISNAHQLDMVGGSTEDEYHGYLVVGQRQTPKGYNRIKWAVVLLDPDGNVVKEIEDLEQFWQSHEAL